MTVDITTGEIVETASLEQAKRITEQIKLLAGAVADGIDRLVERIHEAQTSRVHEVLGYRSWSEYVSSEFAGLLPRLGREPRRELTATLAQTGMTPSAIAPIVNVTDRQVRRDIGHMSDLPPATGLDGKTYTRPTPTCVRPAPVVTQADHDFWDDVAAKAKESGALDRMEAEKPFDMAMIRLRRVSRDITGIAIAPSDLAKNITPHMRDITPEIQQAAEWLADFIAATKECA